MKLYNEIYLSAKSKPTIALGVVALIAMTQPAWGFPLSPIPGAMCQSDDEGALGAGMLIRTTSGIRNAHSKPINIYCPVSTETDNKTLDVTLVYETSQPAYRVGTDIYRTPPLTCWAGFGAKPLFNKFRLSGNGKVSTTLTRQKILNHPVIIKCKLQPGEKLKSIASK